jgi:EAL domain-containing protein (putative c-di-GMP-specific phosphodiesterase class I)
LRSKQRRFRSDTIEGSVNNTTTLPPVAAAAAAIRRVVEERDVRVVYQPVVDLQTKRVYAYEALVRSKDPLFDSPPALFAAAVQHSCTGELGRMIRELSVENCPDHPLFLNIHPAELNEKYLVQPSDPIFQHDRDVFLEITEGVPLSHFLLCKSILHEVRGRGIYLVVDDLGAGYSNLKYIADLHPRVVKLDRELIAGLTTDSRLFTLVSAIVVLCRELGATVVAEGIETLEELDAVIDSGARFGQGYLLARPAFPLPELVWPGKAPTAVRRKRRRTLPRP